MRTALCVGAVLLAVAAHPGASQEKKAKTDDRPILTVTGCVDGSWLDIKSVDTAGSHRERYQLRGSKQLLKEMADKVKGHLIEVTGAVTDTGNTGHRGKTIEIGKKTRIYTGAKE